MIDRALKRKSFSGQRLPAMFVHGYFDDDIWSAEHPAHARINNMHWHHVELDDGTCLTDKLNRDLLIGCKLAMVLIAQGAPTGRPLRGGTILRTFAGVTLLARWISSRGLRSFRELTFAHAISYKQFLRRRRKLSRFKKDVKVKAQHLSTNWQSFLLSIILRVASLQKEMGSYGTTFSISEIEELGVALRINDSTRVPTKVIPDEEFETLIKAATRWLDIETPKVFQVKAAYDAYRHQRSSNPSFQRSRAAYEQISKQYLLSDEHIELEGQTLNLKSIKHNDIAKLFTITRGACFVIIAGLVGMRESEILSIYPGCLESLSIDGVRVLCLVGTLYKTSKCSKGEPARWVAGYDDEANPVLKAISVLERLPRHHPKAGLFSAFYNQPNNAKRRVTSVTVKESLSAFALSAGVSIPLASHQFRKTFARFVARSSASNIFILMRHFKHQSVLMTERYWPSIDPDLLNELFEANNELIAERLDSIFGGERLGGIAGKRIMENNLEYRGDNQKDARRKLIDMTMKDPSAHFKVTLYGLCIYDETKAKCGGRSEDVGLDVCVDCSNFAVDQMNLGFWQDYRDAIAATIDGQTSLGIVNVQLHRQLESAKKVISEICEGKDGRAKKATRA